MSGTLKEELRRAMDQARRDRDRVRASVLSTTLSDLRNREIEEGREADDDLAREVLARAIKQRRESAEQMRSAGRGELADKEAREAEVLQEFLPPPLSDEEVRGMVRELLEEGMNDVGPVMGRLMPRIRGRFDGGRANRIVREELGR